ncbi:DUF5958 family protein [Streptomyces althioticus]|uniref:DUF5958 family protein n=1 Tax=Streptomyces althioticus TaxID=83380 RepID=UPI003EB9FAC6
MNRGQLPAQLTKIINLPQSEQEKAFRLPVALLGVTDKRRRERFCAAGRPHDWHRPVRNQHGAFGLNRRASSPRLRQGTPTTSGRCAPAGRRSHAGPFGLDGESRA